MTTVLDTPSHARTVSAGIHHITAIAGDPRRNYDFYTRVLGLRFVKKTVNFDDPGTYHLYYGNETGAPGTILTFFPWAGVPQGRAGTGQAVEIGYAIPQASLGFWIERLQTLGIAHEPPVKRFGETVLSFRDPDGMFVDLVATEAASTVKGWSDGHMPAEHAVRGFNGVTLWVADPAKTAPVLEALGYRLVAGEGAWTRFSAAGGPLGLHVDLRNTAGFPRGSSGAGTIHHIAFRAESDAAEYALRDQVRQLGMNTTDQLDRNYFRSIYFREPSGVLFELATDDPGFAVDEPVETLGQALKLPAWFEPHRPQIEAVLPKLD